MFFLFDSSSAAAASAPSNTVAPTVTGTGRVGQQLSCSTGTWTGTPTPTYSYQWVRQGIGDISGATNSTYTLVHADAGQNIYCLVTGTNASGNSVAASNIVSGILETPSNTVAPAVTGTPKVGQVLTTTTGTWNGYLAPTYQYQWIQLGIGAISGATNSTYTPVIGDIGMQLYAVVTGTNASGSDVAASNIVGPILP